MASKSRNFFNGTGFASISAKIWGMEAITLPAPMALLQTATKALKRKYRNKKNKQMIQTEQTQQAMLNDAFIQQ